MQPSNTCCCIVFIKQACNGDNATGGTTSGALDIDCYVCHVDLETQSASLHF